MRKKNRLAACTIILIVSVLLCACGGNTAEASGITMKEALQIANECAKQWKEDAALISVISSDNQDTELSSNGYEGKRNCWFFTYKSNLTLKQYTFYVIDGGISDAQEITIEYYGPIPESFISIDTDDAYSMAEAREMRGSADGYNYALEYCQDADTMEILPIISVRGIDENGTEMILNIEAITGEEREILLKSGCDENGNPIWESQPLKEKAEINDDNISKTLSREEIQEKNEIWDYSEEYGFLPEELTDIYIMGIQGSRFAISDCTPYAEEEWEAMMESLYGNF